MNGHTIPVDVGNPQTCDDYEQLAKKQMRSLKTLLDDAAAGKVGDSARDIAQLCVAAAQVYATLAQACVLDEIRAELSSRPLV